MSDVVGVSIDVRQAYLRQQQGARLVDIRGADEIALGYAEGAELIPRHGLLAQLQGESVDPDTPLILICASGQRSLAEVQALRARNYRAVVSVQGGTIAWRAANLPITQPELGFEVARYARQLILPGFGLAGQIALTQARVLIVGAGGLGSPAALYLAAAGVGTLGIADSDQVDLSNLQRQILHQQTSVGVQKTTSAQERLRALNPRCKVLTLPRVDAGNVEQMLQGFDLVIDGSDNFPTRFLLADFCVALRVPLIYGAVLRYSGQVSMFAGHREDQPCYRCLFAAPPPPELAPNCAEAGVLGVLPGLIGVLQATEAIKWIVGIGEPLLGRLLVVDMLGTRFREIALTKDPACVNCGPNPDPKRVQHYLDIAECASR